MYKPCVKCMYTKAEYREAHRDELREQQKAYYEANKDTLAIKKMEHNKVYHSEHVDCDVCGTTTTRNTMYKHKVSPSCKAIANVCK